MVVVLCKKRLLFETLDHSENWQERPPSKGYSLCRVITLFQKLKMQKKKNMLKTFLQDIAVVLCLKLLGDTAYIRKVRPFEKLSKMATKQRL